MSRPDVMVYADARRLEQMLTNLIDNGIKFSRENGTVTISHESGTRDKILVHDNGDGIPAQHLERLFERFYRVDRARSRDMGGTGLGLAIVKHWRCCTAARSPSPLNSERAVLLPFTCQNPKKFQPLFALKNIVVNSSSALP